MPNARSAAALVVILTFGICGTAAALGTVVSVDSGRLKGSIAHGIISFKGIPFALPPTGALRWRAPQPAAHWSSIRDASRFGHDCMQRPFGEDAAPLGTEPAEDCLVLNVWRPAAGTAPLPVMVWIYGGGFVNGGASPAVYDGSRFAHRGIVFVSFNYRLGRFGFFAHPALHAEQGNAMQGNYGYLDQIAALRWIQRNIGAFGGDPNQVTIVGESAGGLSVHMLMTSAPAAGLFHRAIVESGGGRATLLPMRPIRGGTAMAPSAEAIGMRFAADNGIEGDDAGALARLRALSPRQIVADMNLSNFASGALGATYSGPMLDGMLLAEEPEAVYARGAQAKVAMIVGANNADIGFESASSVPEILASFGSDQAQATAAYGVGARTTAQELGSAVGMDRTMIEPARFVAAAAAAAGATAFEYRFSYVALALRAQWSTGAPHATEIPYVFDTVALKYGASLAPEDAAIARQINDYWANFARTGDPNGPGLPLWPRYASATDELMEFTAAGVPRAARDPWHDRLDLYRLPRAAH